MRNRSVEVGESNFFLMRAKNARNISFLVAFCPIGVRASKFLFVAIAFFAALCCNALQCTALQDSKCARTVDCTLLLLCILRLQSTCFSVPWTAFYYKWTRAMREAKAVNRFFLHCSALQCIAARPCMVLCTLPNAFFVLSDRTKRDRHDRSPSLFCNAHSLTSTIFLPFFSSSNVFQ